MVCQISYYFVSIVTLHNYWGTSRIKIIQCIIFQIDHKSSADLVGTCYGTHILYWESKTLEVYYMIE